MKDLFNYEADWWFMVGLAYSSYNNCYASVSNGDTWL